MTRCPKCQFQSDESFKFCPECGARYRESPRAVDQDPLVGLILKGKYLVRRKIGGGAMGTVYEAQHVQLQKTVALKVLHPNLQLNEESLRRFQQEGVVAGRFSHPNAIQVFDFDQAESGALFLAMEYVRGPTLREYLAKYGPQPPDHAVRILAQVLEVLAAAHREGIVHRDLKPDNIMVVDEDGDVPSIKVLDFGVSKIVDLHNENTLMTHTGQILGTPLYMAPEQCSGEVVDQRGDLYSCGVIFFELMAGQTPFTGRNVTELLVKHTTEEVPSLQDLTPKQAIPEDVERVLRRALEKDRERRYQSAQEMLDDLATIRFDRLTRSTPWSRAWRRGSRLARQHRSLLLAGAAGAVLVTAGLWASRGLGNAAANSDTSRVSMRSEDGLSAEEMFYLSLVRRVRQELDSGQLSDAREAVQELHRMANLDAEAYLLRGRVYERFGDLTPARKDYEHALKLDAGFAEAHCAVGWMDLRDGYLDNALASFQRAEEAGGQESEACTGQAIIWRQRGDAGRARDLLQRAIAADPEAWRPHFELAGLQREAGEARAALASLVEVQRRNDSAPGLFLELSRAYRDLGDPVRATTHAREALALHPGDEVALLQLGRLLVEQELFEDAQRELSDWLRHHPECGAAHVLLGLAYHGLRQRTEAITELSVGLAGNGEDADAWALLGTLQLQSGLVEDASRSFESALLINRRHGTALFHLGLIAFDQQRFEDAVDLMERAASAEPHATTHLALGVMYSDYLGDRDSAARHFRRYRDLGGQNADVDRFLRVVDQAN